MMTLPREVAYLAGTERLDLKQIFGPIRKDLQAVETCLAEILGKSRNPEIREITGFLLGSPGKRIRPALVLLSAGAAIVGAGPSPRLRGISITAATAVELIHMASLVHDDLIDRAAVRHHRASVNAKWGPGIAVGLGDYVCSQAMATVCECGDPRLFAVLGHELSAMCVGEMHQVADRAGLRLSERRCLAVARDKTASLFSACCETGAIVAAGEPRVREALRQFGVHLGVVFQILDDCRDLLSDEKDLGKEPGQDLLAGDVTLPLLYGIRCSALREGSRSAPARHQIEPQELASLIAAFRSSQAPERVRQVAESHLQAARMRLAAVRPSDCRESLHRLTDYLAVSLGDILAR